MATALHTARPVGVNLLQMSYAIDYSELIDAATTQSITIGVLPAGAQVVMAYLDLVDPLTDAGSISAVGLEIGTTGDPNAFVVSQELLSGASAGRLRGDGVNPSASAAALKAKFTATGANFGDGATTDLDAGTVAVHVYYMILA